MTTIGNFVFFFMVASIIKYFIDKNHKDTHNTITNTMNNNTGTTTSNRYGDFANQYSRFSGNYENTANPNASVDYRPIYASSYQQRTQTDNVERPVDYSHIDTSGIDVMVNDPSIYVEGTTARTNNYYGYYR